MSKNKLIQKYRWQPELATSIIYWSVVFGAFFLGFIGFLEALSINVLSVFSLVAFVIMVYLGQSRHFLISNDRLFVHSVLKKNRHEIGIKEIDKVSVGSRGMTFYFKDCQKVEESDRTVLMSKKTIPLFIRALESSEVFRGEITSIKKSVG